MKPSMNLWSTRASWVERRVEHAEATSIYGLGALASSIRHDPARHVPRHVELGHDADAAIRGVGHQIAKLVLRVVVAVGPARELRNLWLHMKALVFAQVEMQNVQFDRGYRMADADDGNRLKVTACINQESPPWEPGLSWISAPGK
jgi:hypothetical protein